MDDSRATENIGGNTCFEDGTPGESTEYEDKLILSILSEPDALDVPNA